MRYAIVRDGFVVNVMLWDGGCEWSPEDGCHVVGSEEANIGDSYDGKVFTPPHVEEDAATVDMVKAECSRRICAAFSPAAQANMHGYITLMVIGTVPSSEADTDLYSRAVTWINTMRGRAAELVGNAAYADDKSWPDLGPDLTAFAARF